MGIPDFDHHGLLPAGVFDCTLHEIESRFAWNTRRTGLFANFVTFLNRELRRAFPDPIYFDGSFVTDKEDPADTDVVLDLCQAPDARKWQGVQFMQQHQARVMSQYQVHFWVNLPGNNDFCAFFQYIGVKTAKFKGLDPKHHKGILRVA